MANIMELKHLGSKNGLISHTHTHTISFGRGNHYDTHR